MHNNKMPVVIESVGDQGQRVERGFEWPDDSATDRRFWRRVRLRPGLRANLSRSGVSLSIGRRGMWYTVGPRGRRTTVGLPGTGLFLTQNYPNQPATKGAGGPPVAIHWPSGAQFGRALVIVGEIVAAYSLMIAALYLAKHG
jgi:hypothetical protein